MLGMVACIGVYMLVQASAVPKFAAKHATAAWTAGNANPLDFGSALAFAFDFGAMAFAGTPYLVGIPGCKNAHSFPSLQSPLL